MIVQAMWDSESPLKQLPHVNADVIKRCKDANIESVFDLMDAEVRPGKQRGDEPGGGSAAADPAHAGPHIVVPTRRTTCATACCSWRTGR